MTHSSFRRLGAGWLAALIAMLSLLSFAASAQTIPAWAPNTPYTVGQRVTFENNIYQVRQAHTSLSVWTPPIVPALFLLIGPAGGGGGGDTQAPTAPGNLRATGATTSSISLAWNASTDNVGVTGYDVFRDATRVGGGTATSLTVTGLAANTAFNFTVRARDAAGNVSAPSNQLTARTLANQGGDTQAPTAPTNLRVTSVTTNSVSLAWGASTDNVGVTGYDVVRDAATVATTAGTSFTVTGLAASTSYTFLIRARDAAGNISAPSNSVTGMTAAPTGGGGNAPNRLFVGYWHNFENGSGFIKLRDTSPDFDIVNISFAENGPGDGSITLIPDTRTSAAEIQSDTALLKRAGKKVVLSIGGANTQVELNTAAQRQRFVDSTIALVRQYGFDGIDIDLEGGSLSLNAGDLDFRNPTTPKIINLISAIREIRNAFGSSFVLTMAPETFFVQVGFATYGGAAGAYLPVIHGLRDILTLLQVQLYNTGTVLGLDGVAYGSATADFMVAMSEMMITGFPVAGNTARVFPGLRPDQVAFGLPSSPQAAGSGFAPASEVSKALNYMVRGQSFGGRYVLRNPAGYRSFRGVMTFSVNWDRFAGFTFSRGVRAALNGLPAVNSAAVAPTVLAPQ